MKILFLHENNIEESLGVANLAAMLKSGGHECDVLFQQAEGRNFLKAVEEYHPDVIAFSCSTGRHVWANRIAGQIKSSLNVLTIMGGIHPTLYPEDAIREENIDAICIGEGEYPFLELADALAARRDSTKIKNLWVKQGDRIFTNELRDLNDLNRLPYPDRGLYYKYSYNREMPVKRFMSGLGCPFDCSFCQNHLLRRLFEGKGPFVRRKHVPRVIEEILDVKRKYPLKRVHFSDDLFVTDKDWLREFAGAYRENIGLPFTCNVRISCVDEDKVALLKEAGCDAVTFGLESGSEYLRNHIIFKDLTNDEIIQKAGLLKKNKIRVLTTNMLGLPHESLEDIYESIRLNRRMNIDYVRVFLAKPHKKTRLFEYGREQGLLEETAFTNDSYEDVDNLYFKTPAGKEVKNLRRLFYLIMKLPCLEGLSRRFIRWPLDFLYKWIFLFTSAWQEKEFFGIGSGQGILLGIKIKCGWGRHF